MEKFFTKYNQTRFLDALIKEADGLKILAKYLQEDNLIFIPYVYIVDEEQLQSDKIVHVSPTKQHFQKLGTGLARLHKKNFEVYGYEKDNYIGLNPQKNIMSETWGSFFRKFRLEYQLSLVVNQNVREKFSELLLSNQQKLDSFLDENTEHSSLVHGDLWSGNVLFEKEKVWLIDPAVYYGDREVDIAMTEMFGGFDSVFYDAYEKEYPKSQVYETKKLIYNLYHYLNHYNLFGGGYLSGCERGFEVIVNL